MSNKNAMLACYGYFLGCSRPCLTEIRYIEGVEDAKDASGEGVSAGVASAEDVSGLRTCVGIGLSGTSC